MKKQIEIITKEKHNLDPTKRIKKVTLGYAFNYLIPKQIAEISSKGKIKHLEIIKNTVLNKEKQIYHNNLKTKHDLDTMRIIHIRRKCSQNMHIFGRITDNEIIDMILRLIGKKIEKKQIMLQPIKEIGIYKLHLILEDNLNAEIALHILPNIT